MNYAIGIDLGTTYSCVGIYNNNTVTIIPNNDNEKIIPSFISIDNNNDIIIGKKAKDETTIYTIYDIKRFIGKKYNINDYNYLSYNIIDKNNKPYIQLLNKEYEPEEISALILSYLKKMAESYLNHTINDVVITIPAYFNDAQRQATKKAGEIAGLNILRIINEPTAAAIAYGIDKISDDKRTIIVIDIGGGTTDISLLELEEGVFEVIATSGNSDLGGEDIDNILVEYLADKLNVNLSNKSILKELKLKAEIIKKDLSNNYSVEISNNLFINQDIYNELCSKIFIDFLKPIENVIKDINIIDDVILVGGTTRIPKIKDMISKYFNNKNLYCDINPDEAVATGAAIQAAILAGIKDNLLDNIILLDIIPLSLGIETNGGLMNVIIPKGSTIPIKKKSIFTTAYDNQTYVKIKIFEGERIISDYNNKLGEFIISDIKPQPKGIPQIEVSYYVNNNGILEVSALDKLSGKNEKYIINNLTNKIDDVNKIISNADKYINEDNIYKNKIIIKNKLSNLCYTIIENKDRYNNNIINNANIILNNIDNYNNYDIIYENLINDLSN